MPSIEASPTNAPVAVRRCATPILIFGVADEVDEGMARGQTGRESGSAFQRHRSRRHADDHIGYVGKFLIRADQRDPGFFGPSLHQVPVRTIERVFVVAMYRVEPRLAKPCTERTTDLAITDETELELNTGFRHRFLPEAARFSSLAGYLAYAPM